MIYFWHPVFISIIFSFNRWSEKTNNHKELTVFQPLDECLMIFCESFQYGRHIVGILTRHLIYNVY